jgi:hypothetical protein
MPNQIIDCFKFAKDNAVDEEQKALEYGGKIL